MILNKVTKDKIKTVILFITAMLIWVVSLNQFFLGKPMLFSDALPYYDHITFFTQNISNGNYPLWLNYRVWGVPNEFFLRRIGDFNPVYGIMAVFLKFGIKFDNVYSLFLIFYYFLGMIGFYKVSERFFKSQTLAFISFLLLTFSCFNSLIFRSFLMLIFVPGMWFLYFFMDFNSKQRKKVFFGMTFCLMIILTTYIPFYFLTVLTTLICFYCIFYFAEFKSSVFKMIKFIKDNRAFSILCISILILSLLPGLMLFVELRRGELVLPERQYLSESPNSLKVVQQSTVIGGIPSDNIVNSVLLKFSKLKLGDLYLPIFVYVFLLLGAFVRLNKRLLFFFLFAFSIFLIGVYDASPLYGFLYKHVFIFKYFRNFQFFLWLAIIPVLILICIEHVRLFFMGFFELSIPEKTKKFVIIVFIHLIFALFLLYKKETSLLPYGSAVLSLMVFYLFMFTRIKERKFVFLLLCILAVSYEAFFVNQKIAQESRNFIISQNIDPDTKNVLRKRLMYEKANSKKENKVKNLIVPQYLATKYSNILMHNIDQRSFNDYLNNKFVAYDVVRAMNGPSDFKLFEESLQNGTNQAFVTGLNKKKLTLDDEYVGPMPFYSSGHDKSIQILEDAGNKKVIRTNFALIKFLVLNENYYRKWHVFVNGTEAHLARANFAFMGIVLPKGNNVVEFRYGTWFDYFYKYFMLLVFYLSFVYLLWIYILKIS